jgi:hypothetical protein
MTKVHTGALRPRYSIIPDTAERSNDSHRPFNRMDIIDKLKELLSQSEAVVRGISKGNIKPLQ